MSWLLSCSGALAGLGASACLGALAGSGVLAGLGALAGSGASAGLGVSAGSGASAGWAGSGGLAAQVLGWGLGPPGGLKSLSHPEEQGVLKLISFTLYLPLTLAMSNVPRLKLSNLFPDHI